MAQDWDKMEILDPAPVLWRGLLCQSFPFGSFSSWDSSAFGIAPAQYPEAQFLFLPSRQVEGRLQ